MYKFEGHQASTGYYKSIIPQHAYTVLSLGQLKNKPKHNLTESLLIVFRCAQCLEPDETPSDPASHQATNYVERSSILQIMVEITTLF